MIFKDFVGKKAAIVKMIPLLRVGTMVLLEGNLGTGKTSFAQMLIREIIGQNERVLSPTFSIAQYYDGSDSDIGIDIWHYDLYRIKCAEEVWHIGLDESLLNGISIIEWPENLPDLKELQNKIQSHVNIIRIKLYLDNDNYFLEMLY